MLRALPLIVVLLAAFPAAAGAAPVKLVDCVPALDPMNRSATFEAHARAGHGSARVQIRFSLQVREDPVTGWRRVIAEGFDSWLTSDAGVGRYAYTRTIRNLAAPAAYRTVVRFRWLDAAGAVLARSRATSPACRQPDLRPDLVAIRVDVGAGPTAGTRRYAVTLRNDGHSAAGPFDVGLRTGTDALAPVAVHGLAADEERVVAFTGPACESGAPLVVTTDVGEAVDERDEDDNVLQGPCLP